MSTEKDAASSPRPRDYSHPQRECDLVMKGGITSGIVYPPAALELAEEFRFRRIGGASAGAIAAAAIAAAEFGRESGGFRKLEDWSEWLQEGEASTGPGRGGGGKSHLYHLFQPTVWTRPLMRSTFAVYDAAANRRGTMTILRVLVWNLMIFTPLVFVAGAAVGLGILLLLIGMTGGTTRGVEGYIKVHRDWPVWLLQGLSLIALPTVVDLILILKKWFDRPARVSGEADRPPRQTAKGAIPAPARVALVWTRRLGIVVSLTLIAMFCASQIRYYAAQSPVWHRAVPAWWAVLTLLVLTYPMEIFLEGLISRKSFVAVRTICLLVLLALMAWCGGYVGARIIDLSNTQAVIEKPADLPFDLVNRPLRIVGTITTSGMQPEKSIRLDLPTEFLISDRAGTTWIDWFLESLGLVGPPQGRRWFDYVIGADRDICKTPYPLHYPLLFSLAFLASGVALVVGGSAAGLSHLAHILLVTVPENLYGLCTGLRADGPGGKSFRAHLLRGPELLIHWLRSRLRPKEDVMWDVKQSRSPALTEWLHAAIQDMAGLGVDEDPLTFGQLETRGIKVSLMTTNLSLRRPYLFPLDPLEHIFLFREEDMLRLFPARVVKFMIERQAPFGPIGRVPSEDGDVEATYKAPDGYYFMPSREDTPILVGARISLSFPLLISAVPLYTVGSDVPRKREARIDIEDGKWKIQLEDEPDPVASDLQRNWFSDGGIVSNFPIHLFDSWLPERPTFGINLAELPPEAVRSREPIAEAGANSGEGPQTFDPAFLIETRTPDGGEDVILHPADKALQPEWTNVTGIGSLLKSAFYAAKDHRDIMQSMLPSYRERVVHVRFSSDEGGMNLAMQPQTIKTIAGKGSRAGRALKEKFKTEHHKWVRYRVVMAQLEQQLYWMKKNYNDHIAERGLNYPDLIDHAANPDCSFPYRDDPAEPDKLLRRSLQAALDAGDLAALGADPGRLTTRDLCAILDAAPGPKLIRRWSLDEPSLSAIREACRSGDFDEVDRVLVPLFLKFLAKERRRRTEDLLRLTEDWYPLDEAEGDEWFGFYNERDVFLPKHAARIAPKV